MWPNTQKLLDEIYITIYAVFIRGLVNLDRMRYCENLTRLFGHTVQIFFEIEISVYGVKTHILIVLRWQLLIFFVW